VPGAANPLKPFLNKDLLGVWFSGLPDKENFGVWILDRFEAAE
jgi:hypothetical protein